MLLALLMLLSFGLSATTNSVSFASSTKNLYVSPYGSDLNPGTQSQPFQTISHARDAVRTYKSSKPMDGNIIVNIISGYYALSSTLTFDNRDSGENGYYVTYQGYGNTRPVISGGTRITGWQQDGELWKAYVGTDINMRQLYVNGTRATRARSTNGLGLTKNTLGYIQNAGMQNWKNKSQLEIVSLVAWITYRCGVRDIVGNQVYMQEPCWSYSQAYGSWPMYNPVWIENALELLDSPGEWYLNETTGWIYYKPKAGETMETSVVIAPTLELIMSGKGASYTALMKNIVFSNLEFSYGTWLGPNRDLGYCGISLDSYSTALRLWVNAHPPGNVEIKNSTNVFFTNNTLSRLGAEGLVLDGYTDGIKVVGNQFYNISGNALRIGSLSHPAPPVYTCKNNVASNNYIHDTSLEYPSEPGLVIGACTKTLVTNNELFNLPYSGIVLTSGGFSAIPGYGQNTVLRNYVHDYMKVLNDGGGIYSFGATENAGTSQTSEFAYNVLTNQAHDGGALYLDENSSHTSVHDNVLFNNYRTINLNPNAHQNKIYNNYWQDRGNIRYIDGRNIPNLAADRGYAPDLSFRSPSSANIISNNHVITSLSQAKQDIITEAGIQSAYASVKVSQPFFYSDYTTPCTASDWTFTITPTTCPSSGQQTKTWTKTGNCTGGTTHPATETITCTYQPTACTTINYTAWTPTTCPPTGTQTRTETSRVPTGCTGTPTLTQTCTYVPPTCTSFTYNTWTPATCPQAGIQTRTVATQSPTGCQNGNPALTQTCTYIPLCTEADWNYSLTPTTCPSNGQQTKTWSKIGNCSGGATHPATETATCNYQIPTCTDFNYTSWGACSPSGTQSRTETSRTPTGCQGTPTLTQTCIYTQTCTSANWTSTDTACQPSNTLTRTWTKTGTCSGGTQHPATETIACTYTPPACTATDWTSSDTACQPSNTLTRIWTQTGTCSGGTQHPATETITCTYITPTCTQINYTTWVPDPCPSSGTQTRTETSRIPTGCTDPAVLTQTCTPTTPTCTSTDWTSSDTSCQSDNTLTRTWTKTGTCTGGTQHPVTETITCTYFSPCTESDWVYDLSPRQCPASKSQTKTWTQIGNCSSGISHPVSETVTCNPALEECDSVAYSQWGECTQNGTQNRTITYKTPEGCTPNNPTLSQSCTYTPITQPTTCTSFTYSNWTACSIEGTQTRSVLTASPSGCTNGNPLTIQNCSPPPEQTKTCTQSDWTQAIEPEECPTSATQVITWTKTTDCTGGVQHNEFEKVDCVQASSGNFLTDLINAILRFFGLMK